MNFEFEIRLEFSSEEDRTAALACVYQCFSRSYTFKLKLPFS